MLVRQHRRCALGNLEKPLSTLCGQDKSRRLIAEDILLYERRWSPAWWFTRKAEPGRSLQQRGLRSKP